MYSYTHVCINVVLAAPYWVDKPTSQDVIENSNVTFHCRGDGVPEPTIRWYINGVPIHSEFRLSHVLRMAMKR